MTTFKVGDRIRVINGAITGIADENGKTGEVIKADNQASLKIKMDNGNDWWIPSSGIELVTPEFQVGDTVRVTSLTEETEKKVGVTEPMVKFLGKEGKIFFISSEQIKVEFNKELGGTWNYLPENLVLVKSAEPVAPIETIPPKFKVGDTVKINLSFHSRHAERAFVKVVTDNKHFPIEVEFLNGDTESFAEETLLLYSPKTKKPLVVGDRVLIKNVEGSPCRPDMGKYIGIYGTVQYLTERGYYEVKFRDGKEWKTRIFNRNNLKRVRTDYEAGDTVKIVRKFVSVIGICWSPCMGSTIGQKGKITQINNYDFNDFKTFCVNGYYYLPELLKLVKRGSDGE